MNQGWRAAAHDEAFRNAGSPTPQVLISSDPMSIFAPPGRIDTVQALPCACLEHCWTAKTTVMPILRFHRRQLQRTVWVTLVAWSLALLAGMVNACQVQAQGAGARAAAQLASSHGAHVEGGHDVGQAERDVPTPDPGKAGCFKFCDDESSTVAKGTAPQPDLPDAVIVASVDWRSATSAATAATWRPVERPASQGPPVVIRFLRLTI